MFETVHPLLAEHADLEQQMQDPALHADAAKARSVGRRYAELGMVVNAYRTWKSACDDREAAAELADEDESFAAEVESLDVKIVEYQVVLEELLAPRDPDDARDALLEVKAGEGGAESALFAGDLLRMYLRYAERKGWTTQIVNSTESDLGGIKEATVAIKAKGNPTPAEGVWAQMKFEGGVHRVQRVPATESQGRIHTSAAGVLIAPEADDASDDELLAEMLTPNSLRIDVYRSSGPGGQSVNTTDSAVRITHLPSGVVVSCQNEKSQLQNKESAMRILKARLLQMVREEQDAAANETRRSQVRTMDRSERIRTYNFPENRISDHRTGYKAYNLDAVLDGELGPIIESCIVADKAARLAAPTD
ncbi:peptide chain release factor 1 [Micrococcales bacterium 31B]|nr:peptide chain release factor 1 [Micrococcales bacterium 31B]